MVYGLGPRARRVYAALHERIAREEWPPGAKLPPHLELAAEFGVAPMTIRQVLSRLEEEGLVLRQQGRGTFVREAAGQTVLIVVADPIVGDVLADDVQRLGVQAVTALGSADGLAALAEHPSILLALVDIRLPTAAEGTDFVRAIRRRWPEIPLAVLAAELADLGELYRTSEWPVLVVPMPLRFRHVEEALRLALGAAGRRMTLAPLD
jgi:DNA-binding transcriptional regulator YhcF (GntR family)